MSNDQERSIPYLAVDVPIPFYPRSVSEMVKAKKFSLADAADELARLYDVESKINEDISALRSRIMQELGPLEAEHTELRGRQSLWDIRQLEATTVSWKEIALAMKPPQKLIAEHTSRRVQASFKRLPLEVVKT